MKVWITKYALSSGIFQIEGEISATNSDAIKVQREGRYPELFWKEGKDWHKTEEAARDRCRQMWRAKISSLNKQIQKLKNLKF